MKEKILKRHLNKTIVVEDVVIERDGKTIETTITVTTFYPPEGYNKN